MFCDRGVAFQISSVRICPTGCPRDLGSPDPRQEPESPFSGKEGFGAQKPLFPFALTQAGKGSFLSKIPVSPVCQKSPFPLWSL